MQTIRIYLLLAIAALMILVLNHRNEKVEIQNEHTSEVKKYQAVQQDYNSAIAEYKTKSDSLQKRLTLTERQLEKQQRITRIAGQKLRTVLAQRTDQKGDTLYDAADEYQFEAEKTDSLKTQKIAELEIIGKQKDEAVASISKVYQETTEILTSTLADLKTCEKANSKLNRKTRWQKIKDTALIILTTAIGTFTAFQILK